MTFFCKRRLIGALIALCLVPPFFTAHAASAKQVTIGQTFLASSLDPAEGSTGWALVTHGVAEQLFTVSKDGTIVPNLAASAIREEEGAWTVELAPDRFFSDGTPVTAALVAAALNRTGELNPSARATAGLLIFTATGEHSLSVKTEQPTAILPSILAEWAFPVYRFEGDEIIFTGPFAVKAFESGASLELIPNAHYAGAQARPDIFLRRIADGQSLALAFAAGELDMAFNLPVETLPMLAGGEGKVISFPVAYQYMMWMNTRRPALSDPRVRRAIDLAINRADLVAAAQAGVPATGAFAQNYPFAAEGALPYDLAAAAALLEEAGWKMGPDGVRIRKGEPLELVLYAYPQRPDLVTFQPVVRAALAELGVAVTTQVTESATQVASDGAFDLFLWAQHSAPAGDPGLFLSLFFETDAARNYAGWSNAAYDALIVKLRRESDPQVRVALARQAQAIISAEAPVAFLVTPEWHVGLSPALANYVPWGSDYYIIRPDLTLNE